MFNRDLNTPVFRLHKNGLVDAQPKLDVLNTFNINNNKHFFWLLGRWALDHRLTILQRHMFLFTENSPMRNINQAL